MVLLPAFNHADYVREAVESVLAQTCRDLEPQVPFQPSLYAPRAVCHQHY